MAEAEKVRRIYNRMAAGYDSATDRKVLDRMRARVLKEARGATLELGIGTGATLRHYPADLSSLTALDISEEMMKRARDEAKNLPFPTDFRSADFQRLDFPDASFDTVVTSLALCGIPNPALLFSEIGRVLRPGGRLLSVEHIRPPNPLLGLVADVASPINNHFVGCYLNRRTPEMLRRAGFNVRVLERHMFGAIVAFVATL